MSRVQDHLQECCCATKYGAVSVESTHRRPQKPRVSLLKKRDCPWLATPLPPAPRSRCLISCLTLPAAHHDSPGRSDGTLRTLSAGRAKFSLKCPIGHRVDIWVEKWASNLRNHRRRSWGFSSFVSTPTPLTCTVSGVLTRCPYREFSVSCPLPEWGKYWTGHFQRKDPRHRASIRHCDAMFENPDEIRFRWCEYFCTAIYLEVSGTATIGMGCPIGGGCIAET